MDDPYDLVLGMFALAIAAVMLVAGELYLVMRPDPPKTLHAAALGRNVIHQLAAGGRATGAEAEIFGVSSAN